MTSRTKQQDEEKEVIEKFLQIIGIKIQPSGIQHLEPPFPDVLCSLINGNNIAFELTETVDPKIRRAVDFSLSVKTEMFEYFENMALSERKKLKIIFGNADLYFKFDDETHKSHFQELIPNIFQFLLNCSPDINGTVKSKALPSGVREIRIARGEFVGPMFNASWALYWSDKTIERIREKFQKQYKCDCPIELLIYSRIHSMPPDILWLSDVQELVTKEISTSSFQKVWVFDYTTSEIKYVYSKT